jgi:hypothetical protein
MRIVLLAILFIGIHFCSLSQDETADIYTYGGQSFEEGRSIIQTDDGGYAILGTSGSIGSNTQMLLVKLDINLECMWSSLYGGSGVEKGMSLCESENGNIVLCGYHTNSATGDYDAFLIKVDSDGNVLWSKSVGGSDWDFAYKIVPYNGGYLIAGETYSTDGDESDAVIWYLNESGEILFQWNWDNGANERWDDIDILEDLSIITTGSSGETLIIRKWNLEGGEEWTYTKTEANKILKGTGLDEDEGILFFTGQKDMNGLSSAFQGKLDLNGVELAIQTSNLASSFYFAEPILFEGSIVIPGMNMNFGAGGQDASVFMWTSNYVFIGAPTFGGSDNEIMYDGIINGEGNIICVGSYRSFSEGIEQIGVIKLSAVYGGDYIKTFDYTGDCVSYLTTESLSQFDSCGTVTSTYFYDILGREFLESDVGFLDKNVLIFKVENFSSGCRKVTKVVYR